MPSALARAMHEDTSSPSVISANAIRSITSSLATAAINAVAGCGEAKREIVDGRILTGADDGAQIFRRSNGRTL
jgi:hypothetical protein